MLHLKETKKNTRTHHFGTLAYQNLNNMIYNSWDIERDRLKLVFLGHFLPFYPPKNPKN